MYTRCISKLSHLSKKLQYVPITPTVRVRHFAQLTQLQKEVRTHQGEQREREMRNVKFREELTGKNLDNLVLSPEEVSRRKKITERNLQRREYRLANKEAIKDQKRKHKLKHQDAIKLSQHQYRTNNKAKILEKQKLYRLENKEEIKHGQHDYYLRNKASIKHSQKQYRSKHEEVLKDQKKRYRLAHKETLKVSQRHYWVENKENINNMQKKKQGKRVKHNRHVQRVFTTIESYINIITGLGQIRNKSGIF